MYEKLRARKTAEKIKLYWKGIIPVAAVLLVLSIILFSWQWLGRDTVKEADGISSNVVLENNVQDTVIRELEIIGNEFGEKANLAGLELVVNNADESEYLLKVLKTVEVGSNEILTFEKVAENYEKFYITAFNPAQEDKVFASIKLIDNFGNEYDAVSNPDPEIKLEEFGRDMVVSPGTLRKGYLIFPGVDERAGTLQLAFELEPEEKKVFEFKWKVKSNE